MSYLAFPGLRRAGQILEVLLFALAVTRLCLQADHKVLFAAPYLRLCFLGFIFSFAAVNAHIVARNTLFCIL